MKNRRLTLATPPFSIGSPGKSKLAMEQTTARQTTPSQRGPSTSKGKSYSKSLLKGGSTRRPQPKGGSVLESSGSSGSVRVLKEWSEMSLEEWINNDHFPPLNPGCDSSTISFGLPKHSQPEDSIV